MKFPNKKILAIESSCDETSVAEWDGSSFNEATLSSLKKFASLGGIIPEVASRDHEKAFAFCLEKMTVPRYDYVAYTSEPGLPGSLLLGRVVAETLSALHNAPLIPVNHIHGHIFSTFIEHDPELPALALIVSGGHTALYYVPKNLIPQLLLSTPDDAVGEVLDKVGRELGYDYPGGPLIDQAYDPALATLVFTRKKPFSFSGIKTAIVQHIAKKAPFSREDVIAIGSSTNKALVDMLMYHLRKQIALHHPRSLLLGGGVAANRLLRQQVTTLGLPAYLPSLRYCGDNATMIVAAAFAKLKKNEDDLL